MPSVWDSGTKMARRLRRGLSDQGAEVLSRTVGWPRRGTPKPSKSKTANAKP